MINFFKKNKKSADKVTTITGLGQRIRLLIKSNNLDQKTLDELEAMLIGADIGLSTTDTIINHLKQAKNQDIEALIKQIKTQLSERLPSDTTLKIKAEKPFVILVVGINGVGKTTTIGKITHFYRQQNYSVMLAAGDTFRAAATEQLITWGKNNNVPVVHQATGADSASVIYDALQSAKAKKIDILIADTAGRLHTQQNLMNELKKIHNTLKKLNVDAPHEVLLVIDGNNGQNAISQANHFHQYTPLTGLVVTKLDGSAKGGSIINIANTLKIPIRFIGCGEKITDLRVFNRDTFIAQLFDTPTH